MDLKKLSKEDKLKLLAALEEKDRRSRLKRDVYRPNAGQMVIHRSPKATRLVVSGNGMGKTSAAVNEALWAAEGFNPLTQTYIPVPRKIGVVLDKPNKVTDKWLPELNKWAVLDNVQKKQNGKPYVDQLIFANGSEIKFFFHDQEDLTFESIEVDDLIFDEPPPRRVYVGLKRGQRNKGKNARTLIIGTPLAGAWLRKEIYEPWAAGELPDTECFRFATDVNAANLPEGYVESFSSILTEKERRIRLHGEFFDLDGLALAHLFNKSSHLLSRDKYEFDMSHPCVVSLDPHPSKKHVAILMGADEHGVVVLKELALKATPRQFARELREWYKGYRLIDIVCDSLGSSEMTGGEGFKSFIQVLNEEGVRCRPTTYQDKNDEDWIARIQDVLALPDEPNNFGARIPRLRLMDTNVGCINDIETVEWAKYKNLEDFKPTLDISRKDYLACIKYALSTNLTIKKEKDRVYYRTDSKYGVNMEKRAQSVIKMRGKRRRT